MSLVKEPKTDAAPAPAANDTKDLVVATESAADAAVAAEGKTDAIVMAGATSEKAASIEDSLPAYLAQDSSRLHAAAYRGNVKLMIEILQEDNARISSRRFVTCRAKQHSRTTCKSTSMRDPNEYRLYLHPCGV